MKKYTVELTELEVIRLHLAIMSYICEKRECDSCLLNDGTSCISKKIIDQNIEEKEKELNKKLL